MGAFPEAGEPPAFEHRRRGQPLRARAMEGVQLTALALLVLFGSNWVSQRGGVLPGGVCILIALTTPPVLFLASADTRETGELLFQPVVYHASNGRRCSSFARDVRGRPFFLPTFDDLVRVLIGGSLFHCKPRTAHRMKQDENISRVRVCT